MEIKIHPYYEGSLAPTRTYPTNNNIEKILANSVDLFYRTGMPELAEKWAKILRNYRIAKNKKRSSLL